MAVPCFDLKNNQNLTSSSLCSAVFRSLKTMSLLFFSTSSLSAFALRKEKQNETKILSLCNVQLRNKVNRSVWLHFIAELFGINAFVQSRTYVMIEH